MHANSWYALYLLVWSALVSASVLPARTPSRKGGVTLPFIKHSGGLTVRDGDSEDVVGGTVGLGDQQDLFYSIAVTVGNTTTPVNLDTGSADLWVRTSACQTAQCQQSSAPPYDDSKTFQASGGDVDLKFGDSVTGTHASGPVGRDTITLAGLVMEKQTLAAVNDTDNNAVSNGGSGVLGLGFFSQSFVQAAVVNAENPKFSVDTFVKETANSGPVMSRLILSDAIDEPLFSITLQRDTIDVSGQGQITIGQLPEGVDNSSLTWVPVRLYDPSVGGLDAPTFAPNELYPLRWEVELDGVFLDDKILAPSTQQAVGIPNPPLSALIDTGNSFLRGPSDVVNGILSTVSPAFAASASAQPIISCTEPHFLTFQIGGVRFPVDPRDFISQASGDASGQTECSARNIVATDPPNFGATFSWNLGDPFFKSNLVVFYYGNLTHPSVDPPRMGFKSLVPINVTDLLDDAVGDAQKAGGKFESTSDVAPTASSLIHEGATGGAAKATGTGTAANGPLSATQTSPSGTSGASATPNSAQMAFNHALGNNIWNTLFPVVFGSVLHEL